MYASFCSALTCKLFPYCQVRFMNQTIWMDRSFFEQWHRWLASLWIGCSWVRCQPLEQSAETKEQVVAHGHLGQNMASWSTWEFFLVGAVAMASVDTTGGPGLVSTQLPSGLSDSSSRQLFSLLITHLTLMPSTPLLQATPYVHLARHPGKETIPPIVISLLYPETIFPKLPKTITAKFYGALSEYFQLPCTLHMVAIWHSQWDVRADCWVKFLRKPLKWGRLSFHMPLDSSLSRTESAQENQCSQLGPWMTGRILGLWWHQGPTLQVLGFLSPYFFYSNEGNETLICLSCCLGDLPEPHS